MGDGRKNNGGARKGAGRKPISYETEIREAIEEALGNEKLSMTDIWSSTVKEAKKGSIAHQTTIYNYYYGKPKERIDLTTDDEPLPVPQIILSANKAE